jgi:hypothetical protein
MKGQGTKRTGADRGKRRETGRTPRYVRRNVLDLNRTVREREPDTYAVVKMLTREIGKSALHLAKQLTPEQRARLEEELRLVLLRIEER